MSSSLASQPSHAVGVEAANGVNGQHADDPFTSTPQAPNPQSHRYSLFDTHLFALNHPSASPLQAKRALEAHLAETERRLQEASKLGTALVQQRKNITDRIRDVDARQQQGEIGPELRQKLIDIEKEYNEVGRESARASLAPKADMAASTDGVITASPSKFSSEATDSPSKLNVPRKQRNSNSKSVHNIEFAAEISTSLLAQVRQLQGLLAERDEMLKTNASKVALLEQESEGFSQRLKHLDESEQRYKDENWNLETQIHEMMAAAKEAAGREQKLQQTLAATASEKTTAQRELDDLKQNHDKLTEDHFAARKTHDSELAVLRRNINLGETEKGSLERKNAELLSQNQELARAVASHMRGEDAEPLKDDGLESEEFPMDRSDREHSPPPSPTKGMPRQSMLESETLKSSLHHAHRMIQNLKSNVHREKTEKLDLKRLLQEARDELEVRRSEGGMSNHEAKRLKSKSQQDMAKKPIRASMLGAGRNGRTDVMVDEVEWEDHHGHSPQSTLTVRPPGVNRAGTGLTDTSDAYQTANETEDAFETANERDSATESEAFETGAESIAGGSSDEMTETEEGTKRQGTARGKKPSPLTNSKPGDRTSFLSTASISEDEDNVKPKTPTQAQPQRYRLKINRGSRRSRLGSEPVSSNPSTAKNSPASFLGNDGQPSQSLFAELGDIDSRESSPELEGTPSRRLSSQRSTPSMTRNSSSRRSNSNSRRSISSQRSTPAMRPTTMIYSSDEPPLPRLPQVDSGTMTEPWEPTQPASNHTNSSATVLGSYTGVDTMDNNNHPSIRGPPATPLNKGIDSGPASGPDSAQISTTPATSPRPVWDQPLHLISSMIPTFGPLTNKTPQSTNSAASRDVSAQGTSTSAPAGHQPKTFVESSTQFSRPQTPERQQLTVADSQAQTVESPRQLSLSPIHSLETPPIAPTPQTLIAQTSKALLPTETAAVPLEATLAGVPAVSESSELEKPAIEPKPRERKLPTSTTERILSSVFGWGDSTDSQPPVIAEDETSQDFAPLPVSTNEHGKTPFREVTANATQRQPTMEKDLRSVYQTAPIDMADQSSQTLLSSEQIDRMLKQKEKVPPIETQKTAATSIMKPLSDIGAISPPLQNSRLQDSVGSSRVKSLMESNREAAPLVKTPKRPISTSSIRSRTGQYPPLPADHQQAIAAAAQRAPSTEPGQMGPPTAPASAYRPTGSMRPRTPSRTRTPSEQREVRSPSTTIASRTGTTPRARYSAARSQMSRRSSVSSFASELDERFNIRLDGMPMPQGLESGTDPRMIQAITQTMIGEFLWKYTRKAGRGEMSNNRHRRFFWVHPYTRTLYWSDHDPSTAGRAELKAKSVAIEAVRVVTDDNPMPPGLHRKSLVIITPGRSVKFTATTGQRHETWFNALSYLLLRTGPDGSTIANGDLTAEDVAEFNPTYGNRSARGSRLSLSSFKSQKSANQRTRSQLSQRQSVAQPQTAQSTVASRSSQGPSRTHGSVASRISEYWRPVAASQRGSVSSRRSGSRQGRDGVGSVAGSVGDSAEDLRSAIERGERGGALENVRSCCDGEFSRGCETD